MSNHDDDRLRDRLRRAAEPADPTGAYERILEKRVRRRIARRVRIVGLTIAVVAATAGGTLALAQAFRGAGPGLVPAGSPTGIASPPVEPTVSPSPSAAPSPTATTEPCPGSSFTADFDGDGTPDTAIAQPGYCSPLSSSDPWAVTVSWGSGAQGAWPFAACPTDSCELIATVPMNDGTNALVVRSDQGASTAFYELLSVRASETGPQVYTIADPGSHAFPAGDDARLASGGSVTHLDFITCQGGQYPGGGDMATILATSAVLSADQTTYAVTQTELARGPDPDTAQLIVVATDERSVPFDMFDPSTDVNGVPCWGETAPGGGSP